MKSLPASVTSSSSKEDSQRLKGFCLVDISVLSAVFHLLCCPVCKYGHVELQEKHCKRRGHYTGECFYLQPKRGRVRDSSEGSGGLKKIQKGEGGEEGVG